VPLVVPLAQVVDIPDFADIDYRWDVKQVAAPVALPAFVDNHPAGEVALVDSVEAVPLVGKVVPADSVEAVPQESAEAAPADIDMVSFGKAQIDFANCPTRACPAVAEVAELALWDHIDYDIDLAWSILFCIHAINKKMKQFDTRLYACYPVALENNNYSYIRTNKATVSCRSYFLVQSRISTCSL
jgi:hypothetical protein